MLVSNLYQNYIYTQVLVNGTFISEFIFVVNLWTPSASQTIQHYMTVWLMNNEVEENGSKKSQPQSMYIPGGTAK